MSIGSSSSSGSKFSPITIVVYPNKLFTGLWHKDANGNILTVGGVIAFHPDPNHKGYYLQGPPQSIDRNQSPSPIVQVNPIPITGGSGPIDTGGTGGFPPVSPPPTLPGPVIGGSSPPGTANNPIYFPTPISSPQQPSGPPEPSEPLQGGGDGGTNVPISADGFAIAPRVGQLACSDYQDGQPPDGAIIRVQVQGGCGYSTVHLPDIFYSFTAPLYDAVTGAKLALAEPIECGCDPENTFQRVIVLAGDVPEQPQPEQPPTLPPVQQCCDNGADKIAKALDELGNKLADKLSGPCGTVGECLQKIAESIAGKMQQPAQTCDECCKQLEQGLATKAQCLAVNAHCTCQKCLDECSQSDDGLCCKNCGQEKCKCQGGICVPDTTQTTDVWHSWCNADGSGQYIVTKNDDPTPEGFWTANGDFSNADDANHAGQNCSKQQQPKQPTPAPSTGYHPPPVSRISSECEPNKYVDLGQVLGAFGALDGDVLTSRLAEGFGSIVKDAAGLIGNLGPTASVIATGLGNVLSGPVVMQKILGPALGEMIGCGSSVVLAAMPVLTAIGAAEQLCSVDLSEWTLPIKYRLNAACRQRLIEPDKAMAAYLANAIPKSTADAFYDVAGYCSGTFSTELVAAMSKPVPAELSKMRWREIIDKDEYQDRMRQLGYLDPQVSENLHTATSVIPSLGEILVMMIRDADNQPIVDRFRFDDRLDDKYGPKLKEWAHKQGISDDVVKYAYRSHWDIPSKTELFEFWRRLRNLPDGDPAKITIEDLKAALTHNNVLPRWFDSYLAIAYHPLGRIDIRRSYQLGTLSDDEARKALSFLGYDDDNVDRQFKFLVKLKQNSAQQHKAMKLWIKGIYDAPKVQSVMQDDGYDVDTINKAMQLASPGFANSDIAKAYKAGFLNRNDFAAVLSNQGVTDEIIQRIISDLSFVITDSKIANLYKSGYITRQAAISRLIDRGIDSRVATGTIDIADDQIDESFAKSCVTSVQRRFIRGDITKDEARAKLLTGGIVQDYADRIIGKWQCQLHMNDKAPAASVLCGWYGRGAITADDFVRRMTNIGYTHDDALELLTDCSNRVMDKNAKDQARQAREQASEKAKAEAKARRAAADAEKALSKLEAARKAKAALRNTRQTQLLTAANKVISKCDCTTADGISAVQSQSDRLQADSGLSLDESIRVVLKASEAWEGGSLDSYAAVVDNMASLVKSTEHEITLPEQV